LLIDSFHYFFFFFAAIFAADFCRRRFRMPDADFICFASIAAIELLITPLRRRVFREAARYYRRCRRHFIAAIIFITTSIFFAITIAARLSSKLR
jgi:hypothetical protein